MVEERVRGGVWTFCKDLGGFLLRDAFDLLKHSSRTMDSQP